MNLETLAVALVAETEKFQKGLNSADKAAQGWASKLGGSVGGLVGGAVAGVGLAAGAAIVGIGAAAFDVSQQTDQAAASMAASLGIPRAEAERFADVARQVYGNNLADSVTDAGDAVTYVAQQMKLASDDPALQRITENALRMRDTFDLEVGESVSAVKTLMDNFGISADEAFNLLVAGQQKGLNRSGDLVDTIEEYSTQFANGGASAEQFFGLLESGLQGGMLGTDKAADLFKEFRIRIMEGSDEVATWLDTMEGIVDGGVLVQIRNGTMDVADVFPLVVQGLASIENPIEQHKAGLALMGTQWEDMGASAVLSMAMTEDAFADVDGATDSLSTKYDTFGGAVSAIWRRLVTSISPFTDKLLDLVNSAMPSVMGAFDTFDRTVGPAVENAGAVIDRVVSAVKGFFGGFRSSVDNDGTGALQYWKDWADTNLPLLQTLFNNIIGAIQRLWEIFGPAIQAITDTAFGNIWTVIDTTMRNIGDAITLALQLLTGDFEGAKGTLEDIIQRTWDAIYGIFSNTLDTIRDLITNIDWWGMGSAIIDGIADGIRGAAGRIAEAAESAARRAYNAAKSWLGIHSPSKRFEELGEYSGEGWSVGFDGFISSAAARIDSSLAGVMSDLSPTPAGAGSVSGLGPVSITINLTGNATYENGRLVGRGVLDELRAQGAL